MTYIVIKSISMKNRCNAISGLYVWCGLLLLIAGCKYGSESSVEGLKLVSVYKPFGIYVYAGTVSTNKLPDLIVREGDDPIYIRKSESNQTEITHFEKANGVVVSDYDRSGKLTWRTVRYYDGYNRKYAYFDTNGDGMFELFSIGPTNHDVFMQSNMCWVPWHN